MQKIEVNVQTGEQIVLDLTSDEIAEAQTMFAAWQTEQAAIQQANTTIEQLQAQLAQLTAQINALAGNK